ncbi:MAG: hypothetical protein ACOX22_05855 [Caldicoprobacterales bacterium]
MKDVLKLLLIVLLRIYPDEVWVKKDWSNCNIQAEAYKKKPNPKELPVINKTIKFIEADFDKTD